MWTHINQIDILNLLMDCWLILLNSHQSNIHELTSHRMIQSWKYQKISYYRNLPPLPRPWIALQTWLRWNKSNVDENIKTTGRHHERWFFPVQPMTTNNLYINLFVPNRFVHFDLLDEFSQSVLKFIFFFYWCVPISNLCFFHGSFSFS